MNLESVWRLIHVTQYMIKWWFLGHVEINLESQKRHINSCLFIVHYEKDHSDEDTEGMRVESGFGFRQRQRSFFQLPWRKTGTSAAYSPGRIVATAHVTKASRQNQRFHALPNGLLPRPNSESSWRWAQLTRGTSPYTILVQPCSIKIFPQDEVLTANKTRLNIYLIVLFTVSFAYRKHWETWIFISLVHIITHFRRFIIANWGKWIRIKLEENCTSVLVFISNPLR